MKLTIFQSSMGDCLMLTTAKGARLLIDGGMTGSYETHVARTLGALRTAGEDLAVVCVSHVDNDHIAGVLRMLDDEVAWRVHEFQRSTGNSNHKPPKAPRPPRIRNIWHNAFRDQVEDNTDEIIDTIAASATILTAAVGPRLERLAHEYANIATGVEEAIRVSQRIGADQLGISLNRPAKGKLMMVRDTKRAITVGGMKLYVLAPFEDDLEKLRDEWNKWLREHKAVIADLRRRAREDVDRLGVSELDLFIQGLALDADDLGRRSGVTPPNLASLMLLAEEKGKRVLLTGDGHANEVLRGLEHYGKLAPGGGLHVDALKVPHHGAEFNTTPELSRRVTADHYVFCGNGSHHNPDLAVVNLYADSRLGSAQKRSPNPEASRPFTFWFNSSSTNSDGEGTKRLAHFKKVEALAKKRAQNSGGQMKVKFIKKSFEELTL
ncbi:MAG TPA: MBL fold metallo-hydrolase [Gemmatimonadaceae bacterium]|nr:MBL fold metallo-hydrolase [Gemmatimonadaceae bacterium]